MLGRTLHTYLQAVVQQNITSLRRTCVVRDGALLYDKIVLHMALLHEDAAAVCSQHCCMAQAVLSVAQLSCVALFGQVSTGWVQEWFDYTTQAGG